MIKSIYVTNGGYDAILVKNGTWMMVDEEVMRQFLEAQENGDDFNEWDGNHEWPIEKNW